MLIKIEYSIQLFYTIIIQSELLKVDHLNKTHNFGGKNVLNKIYIERSSMRNMVNIFSQVETLKRLKIFIFFFYETMYYWTSTIVVLSKFQWIVKVTQVNSHSHEKHFSIKICLVNISETEYYQFY